MSGPARVCYSPSPALAEVDRALCDRLHSGVDLLQPVVTLRVEHGTGASWTMERGQVRSGRW